MEIISKENINCLSLVAEEGLFSDREFKQFVDHAFRLALVDEKEAEQNLECLFPSKQPDQLRSSYKGMMTLALEAAKQDLQSEQVELLLEDSNFMPDRKDIFVAAYDSYKGSLRTHLSRFGVDTAKQVIINTHCFIHMSLKFSHLLFVI